MRHWPMAHPVVSRYLDNYCSMLLEHCRHVCSCLLIWNGDWPRNRVAPWQPLRELSPFLTALCEAVWGTEDWPPRQAAWHTLYSAWLTLHNLLCIIYSAWFTRHNLLLFSLHNQLGKIFSVCLTLHNLFSSINSAHFTLNNLLCSVNSAQFSLRNLLCTICSAQFTLHNLI